MKTGLIVGKFLPPHKGHLHLINFAEERVDELLIVVGSQKSQEIPGYLRKGWLQKLVGLNTQVYHIPDNNPPHLGEGDDHFWSIWRDNLKDHLPYVPDVLFSSESYGAKLAEVMGMEHVSVDPDRKTIGISGTMIREDPQKYWDYIPDVVKPYYLQGKKKK